MRRSDRPISGVTVNCAIYTRKSSEDGLEQQFNSLDAQREACEAYVVSQRHAGWKALPDMYDDGGLSGGTMERPALQRLLADVKAGKIQTIVVYKVDRLTRSLADFAKIVDVLDAHNASFVSVTQPFNTTTSMGRLTLNMLLSFADDIEAQPGLFALLPQVADAINLPVVAAGGIADARGIVAAFALGASAAQIGTAYLLTPQATISELHRAALRAARDDATPSH